MIKSVIYYVRGGMISMYDVMIAKNKKCAYSYWGFLGDVKLNLNGDKLSTPDGNAFYSWSIISELINRGYEVVRLMPNRDLYGYSYMRNSLFSWAQDARVKAYRGSKTVSWSEIYSKILKFRIGAKSEPKPVRIENFVECLEADIMSILIDELEDCEFILHEYRMLINSRNNPDSIMEDNWQIDWLIQKVLFRYCCENNKKLIIFDLDYKFDVSEFYELLRNGADVYVLELGDKWKTWFSGMVPYVKRLKKVYIPFDFDYINWFRPTPPILRQNKLVYIGNRYERDWCINKYIPKNIEGVKIYGNWLESGRNSKEEWPYIDFGERLQTVDMSKVYNQSLTTILLAKSEYCRHSFMTARVIESVFYGCVPLFIEDYGKGTIKEYAGKFADDLTVSNARDVEKIIDKFRYYFSYPNKYENIIYMLRDHLRFMDVRGFVSELVNL